MTDTDCIQSNKDGVVALHSKTSYRLSGMLSDLNRAWFDNVYDAKVSWIRYPALQFQITRHFTSFDEVYASQDQEDFIVIS